MFNYNGIKIRWLGHDSFLIYAKGMKIYLDPYELTDLSLPKADMVFCSHEHGDHCDPIAINLISSDQTILIGPKITTPILSHKIRVKKEVQELNPGENLEIEEIKIGAITAYNTHRFRSPGNPFHPKSSGHIGVILDIDGIKLYHAGDTDKIPEMEDLKVDIAFLPVSGKYVMDVAECVEAAKVIKPKVVIPMHVGRGIGEMGHIQELKKKLVDFRVEILDIE